MLTITYSLQATVTESIHEIYAYSLTGTTV